MAGGRRKEGKKRKRVIRGKGRKTRAVWTLHPKALLN